MLLLALYALSNFGDCFGLRPFHGERISRMQSLRKSAAARTSRKINRRKLLLPLLQAMTMAKLLRFSKQVTKILCQ